MRLRPAESVDVPAVAALEAAVFGADAWSSAVVEAELLGRGRLVLVADQAGTVVGYVVLMPTGDVADLNRIAVAPDHRRRGLASALLAAAIDLAVNGGVGRLVLEVGEDNLAAIAFYARAEFVVIARREGYYRDGSAALVMERRLTPPHRT